MAVSKASSQKPRLTDGKERSITERLDSRIKLSEEEVAKNRAASPVAPAKPKSANGKANGEPKADKPKRRPKPKKQIRKRKAKEPTLRERIIAAAEAPLSLEEIVAAVEPKANDARVTTLGALVKSYVSVGAMTEADGKFKAVK
jgi:hypothetical protein